MLNIDDYLYRIMGAADLTKSDSRRVRAELKNHVEELLDAGTKSGLNESEVAEMIEKEFGNAEELGKQIAKAKGKFLTYLKKQTKKTLISLLVMLVIALCVRAVVFEAFYVPINAVPQVPANSRILVNKLQDNFEVEDVIVYRPEKQARVGVVKAIDNIKNGVIVQRTGEEDTFVSKESIVGKAIFIYFRKL